MAEQPAKHWFVIQAKDSKYADVEGRAYEYPRHIPQAQRVAVGDILVVAVPKASAPDGRRILGLGRVERSWVRALTVSSLTTTDIGSCRQPAAFEEIGGDPRKNQTNSINPIDPEIAKKLLAREGVADIESLPVIVSEPSRQQPPPSDHDLRELLHDAVVKDLLGPASGPDEEIRAPACVTAISWASSHRKRSPIDQADTGDLARGRQRWRRRWRRRSTTLMSQSIVPSSCGLTFCVDASCEALEMEVTWGHYRKTESEVDVSRGRNPSAVWKRRAAGGTVALDLRVWGSPALGAGYRTARRLRAWRGPPADFGRREDRDTVPGQRPAGT